MAYKSEYLRFIHVSLILGHIGTHFHGVDLYTCEYTCKNVQPYTFFLCTVGWQETWRLQCW